MNNLVNNLSLEEVYLFANTPAYLYKELRGHEQVIDLATRYSTKDLIQSFKQLAEGGVTNSRELAAAYGLYVAIMVKDDDEAQMFLSEYGPINVDWFPDLMKIYHNQMKPTVTWDLTSSKGLREKVEFEIF